MEIECKKKPPRMGGDTAANAINTIKTRQTTHQTVDARHPKAAAPKTRTETPQRATPAQLRMQRTPTNRNRGRKNKRKPKQKEPNQ